MAGLEIMRMREDAQRERHWKRWGPYLAERQWGTVREDYSANGDVWGYFPHDHARSRTYRWGEDGLLGISDAQCRLCFSVALWNGRDPFLKERLFGVSGPEGNHGEDVKECYYYLDSTPTHSYLKALYKYPQAEFPYERLLAENRERSRNQPEFEILDSGVFDDNRYWDVLAEYAKADPNDIFIRLTLSNRGPDAATIDLLPTLLFRNTWSWGKTPPEPKPLIASTSPGLVTASHETLGRFRLYADLFEGTAPATLMTENETNRARLFGAANTSPYVKDLFHDAIVGGRRPSGGFPATGTKAAFHYHLTVPAGESVRIHLRLVADDRAPATPFGGECNGTFITRLNDANSFYSQKLASLEVNESRAVARQAYAGLLWSKQFYHYVVRDWLQGDPNPPPPPPERLLGRNRSWNHIFNRDVISMPDKWEYPWYAAWDLAFQMIPFARVDREFAQEQLILFLREWYMHPNGQLPAYEWELGDVNPPVHAWAAWRVYKMSGARGERDRTFLQRVFHKLLINFAWWVNRKDLDGNNLFSGGFLGLDNIGVFDRSKPLPSGQYLQQADGTAWMAFYCATMLSMALELARDDQAYEDIASKFFEHFVAISDAINTLGGTGLWDEEDGFYYDQLRVDADNMPIRIRSIVGLVPILACENVEQQAIERLPGFSKRMQWFLDNRTDLAGQISYLEVDPERGHGHRLLAIPSRERLERVLRYVLDPDEFLSEHGVRSLSRRHAEHPFIFSAGGEEQRVAYSPGESESGLFGGNSNWRGPVWFPINYLLIEALERYHHYYGDSFQVECPTGSGNRCTLGEVAQELARRLSALFLPDASGRRPCHGDESRYADDPHWRDLVLFHEYFHGETGQGLGASHQTGWTALVVRCLEKVARPHDIGRPSQSFQAIAE